MVERGLLFINNKRHPFYLYALELFQELGKKLNIIVKEAPMAVLVFFLRKISSELTSAANPPLFAEEDYP